MYSTLIIASNEGLLNIVINRPDKLNALNTTVLEELKEVVQKFRNDNELKGAIITGAGENHLLLAPILEVFYKPNDLKEKS